MNSRRLLGLLLISTGLVLCASAFLHTSPFAFGVVLVLILGVVVAIIASAPLPGD